MKPELSGKEELRRISLTLPNSLYEELDSVIRKWNLRKVEVIRQAISFWLEHRIADMMAEGYRAMAREDLEMLQEFKHVDREVW